MIHVFSWILPSVIFLPLAYGFKIHSPFSSGCHERITAQAVAACREFILSRVSKSLGGLTSNGEVDLNQRVALPVHLSLRGKIDVNLPLFTCG